MRKHRTGSTPGWVFTDVLVALALLAVALGFLVPAISNLRALVQAREDRVFSALEADRDDVWTKFR
jgi:tRNA A37 threonylcarbamoyladenosine modification protein TsaB